MNEFPHCVTERKFTKTSSVFDLTEKIVKWNVATLEPFLDFSQLITNFEASTIFMHQWQENLEISIM